MWDLGFKGLGCVAEGAQIPLLPNHRHLVVLMSRETQINLLFVGSIK